MDPSLAAMKEIAQPLDRWCDLCGYKLATAQTQDGVWACPDCQKEYIEALAKYAAEAQEVEDTRRRGPMTAQKAKAKAKRRAKRKRTKR